MPKKSGVQEDLKSIVGGQEADKGMEFVPFRLYLKQVFNKNFQKYKQAKIKEECNQ